MYLFRPLANEGTVGACTFVNAVTIHTMYFNKKNNII